MKFGDITDKSTWITKSRSDRSEDITKDKLFDTIDMLWEERERLHRTIRDFQKQLISIPCKNFYQADRIDDDKNHNIHLWDKDGNSFDITISKD